MHRLNHSPNADPRVGLVLVGFGDPRRLQAIARRLGWTGPVLSDPTRTLYARLGIGRAPWWRVYNPGTLRTYWRAARSGTPIATKTNEDTRQLGGDAILTYGSIIRVWRPRTPDDRPPAAEVLAEASRVFSA